MTTPLKIVRTAVIALFLTFSAATAVVAQDATEVAGQVTNQAEDAVKDDDGGFDWGLLGLLGLGGLAGLMRRPQPVVHEDLHRTGTGSTGRVGVRRDDDTTV
jgi:MYXO-CTERM domain-containing protein